MFELKNKMLSTVSDVRAVGLYTVSCRGLTVHPATLKIDLLADLLAALDTGIESKCTYIAKLAM